MCLTLVRICVCKIEILKQVQSCTFLIPETHKKKLCKDFDPCNKIVPGDLFAFYSSSGKSPGTIRPLAKPFSRFILPIGQVAWNNYTTRETLFLFYSSSGRSPGTIRPLAKPFSRFIRHQAGRLEQLDHSRNPFRVLFFLSGRSPGTITPLAKPFSRFILQRAGRLEQLDHSRNSSRSFIIGQVAQNNLIHFKKQQKQKQKNKKKWVIVQMTCFLISTSLCKIHMSISCF